MVSDASKLISEFSALSQALSVASDEDARLKIAVEAALGLVTRCDHAGLTMNSDRGLDTRLSSDEVVMRANELQNELGEGPCLDLMRDQNTIVIVDLAEDRRYPRWARRVSDDLGVGAMMSLLIYTDRHSFGALSLYADRGHTFDVDDVATAQALAAHLAVVITAEREIDHLGLAMHNRLILGQAQGILMARVGLTADAALDFMKRASSVTNRKMAAIAMEIAQTGRLPDLP